MDSKVASPHDERFNDARDKRKYSCASTEYGFREGSNRIASANTMNSKESPWVISSDSNDLSEKNLCQPSSIRL
jgi:hypothetical protein